MSPTKIFFFFLNEVIHSIYGLIFTRIAKINSIIKEKRKQIKHY